MMMFQSAGLNFFVSDVDAIGTGRGPGLRLPHLRLLRNSTNRLCDTHEAKRSRLAGRRPKDGGDGIGWRGRRRRSRQDISHIDETRPCFAFHFSIEGGGERKGKTSRWTDGV